MSVTYLDEEPVVQGSGVTYLDVPAPVSTPEPIGDTYGKEDRIAALRPSSEEQYIKRNEAINAKQTQNKYDAEIIRKLQFALNNDLPTNIKAVTQYQDRLTVPENYSGFKKEGETTPVKVGPGAVGEPLVTEYPRGTQAEPEYIPVLPTPPIAQPVLPSPIQLQGEPPLGDTPLDNLIRQKEEKLATLKARVVSGKTFQTDTPWYDILSMQKYMETKPTQKDFDEIVKLEKEIAMYRKTRFDPSILERVAGATTSALLPFGAGQGWQPPAGETIGEKVADITGGTIGTLLSFMVPSKATAKVIELVPGLAKKLEALSKVPKYGKITAKAIATAMSNVGTFGLQGQVQAPLTTSIQERVKILGESEKQAALFAGAGLLSQASSVVPQLAAYPAMFAIGYGTAGEGASETDKFISGLTLALLHATSAGMPRDKAKLEAISIIQKRYGVDEKKANEMYNTVVGSDAYKENVKRLTDLEVQSPLAVEEVPIKEIPNAVQESIPAPADGGKVGEGNAERQVTGEVESQAPGKVAEVAPEPPKLPQESVPAPLEAVKPTEPIPEPVAEAKPPVEEPTVEAKVPELMTPGGYLKRGLKQAIEMRKEGNSLAGYDEQSKMEWLGGIKSPKTGKLTLYRATPTGEKISAGDYVTNDKSYAQLHIDSNLGGKGKITEIEATLDDIFPADGPKEFWYAPKSIEPAPVKPTGSQQVAAKISEVQAAERLATEQRLINEYVGRYGEQYRGDAEDAVSAKRSKFKEGRGDYTSFMRSVLKSQLETARTEAQRNEPITEETQAAEPIKQTGREEVVKNVFDRLELKDAKDRRVLDLYRQGLEQVDIAEKLGMDAPTVSKRINNIENELRSVIKKLPPSEQDAVRQFGEGPGTPLAKRLGLLTTFGVDPGKSRLKGLLDTVKKSEVVSEETKKTLENVEPKYEQQKTKQIKNKVLTWFTEDKNPTEVKSRVDEADSMIRDPKEDLDTKGAVGVALLEHYRNTGNDTASVALIEHLDPLMRSAGRLTQAASMFNQVTGNGWISMLNKYLTKRGVTLPADVQKQVELEFKLSAKMSDEKARGESIAKTVSKVASYVPFKVGEWLDAYRYGNMLSNPQSGERNIHGNIVQSLITEPLTLIATKDYAGAKTYLTHAIGKALSVKTVKDAWVVSRGDFNRWVEALDDPKMSIFDAARLAEGPTNKGKRAVWKTITLPQRLLNMQDQYFGAMIKVGKLASEARKGTPYSVAETIAEKLYQENLYRNRPEKIDKSQPEIVQALDFAMNLLDQGRKSESGLFRWPMKIAVPFLTTPMRISQYGVKASPLAYIGPKMNVENIAKAKYGKSFEKISDSEKMLVKEELNHRRGLAALGNIVALAGAGMALTGNTTWGVPQDPKSKEEYYNSGRRPYSFRIGNKWIPMMYLGPWFLAMALPTAVKEAFADNPDYIDESYIKKLGYAAAGIPKIMLAQTPLASVDMLMGLLLGKIDRSLAKTIGFQASQFIPGSGLLRWFSKMTDPKYRKPVTVSETIKAGIPGLSNDLKAYTGDATRDWTDIYLPYTIGNVNEKSEAKYQSRMEMLRRKMRVKNAERKSTNK